MTDSNSPQSHPKPFEDHIYQPVQRDPEVDSNYNEEEEAEGQDQQERHNPAKLKMDSRIQRHLARVQVITPLCFLLNLASLVICSILVHPNLQDINKSHITQFTPNPNFILSYWGILFLLQIGFAVLIVVSQKDFTKRTIVNGVGVRLAFANLCLGAWAITWVVNNNVSFIAGLVLLSIVGLLLFITALILAIKYPPSTSRPLDWLFIHVPIKMFLAITLQIDIPQMIFMALGWYDTPKSTETDMRAIWPSFGILTGTGAISAIWIFAATDVTWAISGIFLYFSLLYSKSPKLAERKPEIVAAIILAMVLQAVGLIGSILYKWLASQQLADQEEQEVEGRIALGRDPQEEAAALRAEAEAEAAAAKARERVLSEEHANHHAATTSTTSSDDPSSLERGENNVKVSRRLG